MFWDYICIGYTWSRIPISRKFGNCLADFCLFIGRFLSPKSRRSKREESEFGKVLDYFSPFFSFQQTFGFWKIGFGQVSADLRIASEYLPDILHSFQKNWGKRIFFFGFWRWNLGKNLPKKQGKKCWFSGNSEFGLTCSQCIMEVRFQTKEPCIVNGTREYPFRSLILFLGSCYEGFNTYLRLPFRARVIS